MENEENITTYTLLGGLLRKQGLIYIEMNDFIKDMYDEINHLSESCLLFYV